MASIRFDGVTKRYSGGVIAVDRLSLDIADREFVVLLGPSGCGKSTTLNMIAGLEDISEGDLYLGDQRINAVPPHARDCAMVFQSYALYPHKSVYENIAFGLRMRKFAAAEIDARVRDAARRLSIDDLLDRRPSQLSGGQRQRVALGRAIVRRPAVFLMDEPLSNLDAALRVSTRAEIKELHQSMRTTFVYVTHDQAEALTLADRIVVMKDGVVQQAGSPETIYERPANVFVASFLGNPPINLMDGTLDRDGERVRFQRGSTRIVVDSKLARHVGRDATLGIRSEDLAPAADGALRGRIHSVLPIGSDSFLGVDIGERRLFIRVGKGAGFGAGESIALSADPDRLHLFDRASGERLEP